MKQIYYSLQTLIRGRGSNVIKIISLTLGLFVGILLFARVTFELNYDSFYSDVDKLYLIQAAYTVNGEKEEPTPYIYGKLPGAIKENFPGEVEDATVIREMGSAVLFNGNNRFEGKRIYTDQYYFSTAGLELKKGRATDLATPDVVFLSASLAKRIFGDSDPMGMTLNLGKDYPVTVRGVYADLPENTNLEHDIIVSYPTIDKQAGSPRGGWGYDISYFGLVRFRDTADAPRKVTQRIPEMMKKYITRKSTEEFKEEYSFMPIKEYHSSSPDVRRMVLIMSVLAITIILIAALNYVLISVSSFAQRAKAVGVHKCNGATEGDILTMFLWETALIILASLLLGALLMVNLKGVIEDTMDASLEALFTWQTLWVPSLVVILLFLLTGVLPGRMFSSVPVTQVFRRYAERKTLWKRPLLFVQFAGIPFVFGILVVVLMQYHRVMNRDLGYNPDRVVAAGCWLQGEEAENVYSDIRRLPMVEDVSSSWSNISNDYSGYSVYDDNGKMLFDARTNGCDFNFIPMMGIRIIEGKNFDGERQAIINEEYVKRMHWTDSPIGKKVNIGEPFTVVGVMKNYANGSAFDPQDIVLLLGDRQPMGGFHVRLKEPFDENLKALNEKMTELYATKDIVFTPLQERIDNQYIPVRRFRDSVMIASFSILLITLMGLFGYVNDEVLRRSKEIAIRKVNGAGVRNILELLSKGIAWTALPAVILGSIASYFISNKWLEQFNDSIEPGIPVFICIAMGVLALIIISVILRAWSVANENPVKSIKAE